VNTDLRSDTVTRPTDAMRRAMAEAEVGDALADEDPTVNRLQDLAAARLGKEAALYLPSGTMANQLAVRALARPGTEVLCGARAHVNCYEDAGLARNAGVQIRTLHDEQGVITADQVHHVAHARHHHHPTPTLLVIENTHMVANGRPVPADEVTALCTAAHDEGMAVHCDGARIWNAAIALGESPAHLTADCDTVMFCLSKGLGAPIGSVLCGERSLIEEIKLDRHRMGGGWRQAGIVAAAGIVALETMVDRLADDHHRARVFADALAARWPGSIEPSRVHTNIVCADLALLPQDLLARLAEYGVLADLLDPYTVRFVFHLDVDDRGLMNALAALDALRQR
jgi:threonine aldolase